MHEFGLADMAYRTMVRIGVGDFGEYDAAWREFLHRIERVWTKTHAAAHGLPGWQKIESEVVALRKSDPLLCYLIQARNVDEHTISPVAQDWNANIRMAQTGNEIRAAWDAWDRPLLPVKNRGVVYEPPRKHLGAAIEPLLKKGRAEPVIVAELALRFYVNFINRVSSEVVGKRRDA
jgi:hypothetical protein